MVMFILYYLYSNIRYLCTDWRTFYTDRGGCRCIGRTEQCLLLSGSYRATPEYGHCKFRQCLQNWKPAFSAPKQHNKGRSQGWAAARKKSRNAAFRKRKNENFFDEQCDWLWYSGAERKCWDVLPDCFQTRIIERIISMPYKHRGGNANGIFQKEK